MAPSEAAAMPLPREETTPPVTKMKRVMQALLDSQKTVKQMGQKPESGSAATVGSPSLDGAPDYQNGGAISTNRRAFVVNLARQFILPCDQAHRVVPRPAHQTRSHHWPAVHPSSRPLAPPHPARAPEQCPGPSPGASPLRLPGFPHDRRQNRASPPD